jgi:hypothetical protein
MVARYAAAAERCSTLNSGSAVFSKGVVPEIYRIHPETSTFAPIGNAAAEVVLATICRYRHVPRPVGRALMMAHGIGRAL